MGGECHLWVCPYFFSSVPASLAPLTWMLCEMEGKWPYNSPYSIHSFSSFDIFYFILISFFIFPSKNVFFLFLRLYEELLSIKQQGRQEQQEERANTEKFLALTFLPIKKRGKSFRLYRGLWLEGYMCRSRI